MRDLKNLSNNKQLSETDIITKFIIPVVVEKGWDSMTQIRQEVKLRDGKVIVRGQIAARKKVKFADIVQKKRFVNKHRWSFYRKGHNFQL